MQGYTCFSHFAPKHRLWVLIRIYVLSKNIKNFLLKIFNFNLQLKKSHIAWACFRNVMITEPPNKKINNLHMHKQRCSNCTADLRLSLHTCEKLFFLKMQLKYNVPISFISHSALNLILKLKNICLLHGQVFIMCLKGASVSTYHFSKHSLRSSLWPRHLNGNIKPLVLAQSSNSEA